MANAMLWFPATTAAALWAPDEEGLARETLEADYIIDIYVLDGIGHFPDRTTFQQFAPDGTPVGEPYYH